MADDRLINPQYVWNQLDYEHDALIEASAGTGKTYALESIVLKLVQGKGYDATSILLVTFTEKAAGELKDRIRKALEAAGKLPANFDEMTICTIHSFCRQLLSEYAFENGVPMKSEIGGDSNALAHKAVLEALSDSRFAKQYKDTLFEVMEISRIKTINELVETAQKFIGHLDCDERCKVKDEEIKLAKAAVKDAAKKLQDIHGENPGQYIIERARFWTRAPKFYEWLRMNFDAIVNSQDEIFSQIVCGSPSLVDDLDANSTIRKWDGVSVMNGRSGGKLFDSCPEYAEALACFLQSIETFSSVQAWQIVLNLALIAAPIFQKLKSAAAMLTFDDMVARASEVVTQIPCDEKEKVAKRRFLDSVRERYRVALVDEFQDTDAHQWDIFRTLFSSQENKVAGKEMKPGFLIVVGDPKQSIYSFRGADVKVYCAARDQIAQRKTLDETYRSRSSLVDVFNICFRDDQTGESGANYKMRGSDWFKNGAAGEGISYKDVSFPRSGNKKFDGLCDDEDAVLLLESMPDRVSPSAYGGGCFGNNASCLPAFIHRAAREMLYLKSLNPAPWTRKEHDEEKTTFSYGDMCVLVATNNDAAVVRRVLAKYGIPYGQYKQQGIYKSPEAEGVLALLDYLVRPNGSGNRAALLISPIFGIHPSRLSQLPQVDAAAFDKFVEGLQKFAADKEWNKLFERVMSDPCTALVRPADDLCAFDRTRAAVRQIFDDLLAQKGGTADDVSEFAAILREWRKNDKAAGEDGALFKKESEADRVQIMTMHASKGLQFPIVFVAYGFSNQIKGEIPEEDKPATLEERRRLLYVALTRAEYRLYLPWSERAWEWKGDVHGSGIGSVGSALLVGDNPAQTKGFLGHAIQVYFKGKENSAFAPDRHLPGQQVALTAPHLVNGSLSRPPFDEMSIPGLRSRRVQWDSFSSIPQGETPSVSNAQKTVASSGGPQQPPEPHDPTVKAKTALPRNNVSGNVFHEIMETLCKNEAGEGDVDFTTACDEAMKDENSPLRELIRKTMNKNQLANREVDGRTTEEVLLRMVQNALATSIKIGAEPEIVLKNIEKKNRLAEVEFVAAERHLLDNLPEDREGAMNGKIDLLVRVDDKVFVLDWKTNSLPDYDVVSTSKAMDEAGYHLQYKIYSLAASEWIKPHKLTVSGVAYLFVRGGEVGDRSGVFARVFDASDIANFREEISKMGYFSGKKENA